MLVAVSTSILEPWNPPIYWFFDPVIGGESQYILQDAKVCEGWYMSNLALLSLAV
jgi:hypothetical protein